jgi:6-phospho-beta-glucosidase
MKVVFVGGGSFRTLPLVRAAMTGDNVFLDGDIRLVDVNLERAETVSQLILRTPEFAGTGCRIRWTRDLDEALPGADLVCISFPVGSARTCLLSCQASSKHGFYGSDQLSISGAFRSLTGGPIILGIARRMERHCPQAWLVDHANPVAVYSGLVNNHTRIRALGLCGSCYHPRWDLTRLLYEEDEYRDEYTYATAGVNHLTFLLRGQHRGRDIIALLDEKYGDRPWKPRLANVPPATLRTLHFSYRLFRDMRRQLGILPCANELDGGTQHLFPDEKEFRITYQPVPAATIRGYEAQAQEDRRQADLAFRAHLDRELDAEFWDRIDPGDRCFGAAHSDPTVVVMKALGTERPRWLAASHPNRGAVRGFKDRTVLEYSFSLDRQGIHPDPDLEIPDSLHGVISSLASHQALLGDAIATRDPQLFAAALFAYPTAQNSRRAKALWRDLLKVHAGEIPAEFQKTKDYLV